MKKIIYISTIIIILITGIIIFTNQNNTEKNNSNNFKYIKNKIQKVNQSNKENLEIINTLLKNKNFKKEKLENYLILIKKGVEINDSVYIVNNNFFNDKTTYNETTINLMKSNYYIHDNLNRYINYKSITKLEDNKVITNVNANLDYEFYNHDMQVDLSKKDLILVNKFYKLDSNYIPEDLFTIDSKYGQGQIKSNVYEAYKKMYNDATKQNLHLKITSPYRSYNTQSNLYNKYVNRDGKAKADTYSARPGYSEHQTGLALDIITSTSNLDTFENTQEFKWLQANAYKYGFILRYPKDKEDITGYSYESWHYRYVGEETAKKIKKLDITFDEYYAYFIK